MIIGIDEVGRGAWAGPLCVGAVALGGVSFEGLTDSKLLSKKKREVFARLIKQQASRVGIGWVSAKDIDSIGISAALKLAASRALSQIDGDDIDQIIIDGTIKLIDDPRVTTMKKADLIVPSVSAASVVAKVARDEYMSRCHELFADYAWHSNVGYGAAIHKNAIEKHGVTALHRMSFAPMKGLELPKPKKELTTAKRAGNKAEDIATSYLEALGFRILDRNWKTRWCEVDIIVQKDGIVSFVEVKYRSSSNQGGGLAAITPSKLKQMTFAAKLWLSKKPNIDANLAVIEVSGKDFDVTSFIPTVL